MRRVLLAAATGLALVVARDASACAPAPRQGAVVAIADEEAIIGYDPANGREDFIRRASFRTAEKDFGFLVPTPTRPELSAAPDDVFDALARLVAPRVVTKEELDGVSLTSVCMLCARPSFLAKSAVPTSQVAVLETKRVAGYDATVLSGDDADAIAHWLAEHGYDKRPSLSQWLDAYVQKRWVITAFKIAASDGTPGSAIGTEAVRMTFTTDKPLFPYREPEDQRATVSAATTPSRLLRLYLVTPGRQSGSIGGGKGIEWPGVAVWADARPASIALPFAAAAGAWLTAFEDKSSPRPGVDDLFFSPARDASPVAPPPIVNVTKTAVPIPIELLLAAGGALFLRWRKRRRATSRAAD